MRFFILFIISSAIGTMLALTEQELAIYRNHIGERLFKEIPGIVANLKQRDDRVDIPTNKEVHLSFAALVIANLLPPAELQALINLSQFKNIAQRAELFSGQPESVRTFLETIVDWLSQLNQLRFEGKQYLSNYISEFVKLAPYAQAVITDPDDWQTFVKQIRKFQTIIRSAQFLAEHQDLKPKDIEFALSLLRAPEPTTAPTPIVGMDTYSQQLVSLQERFTNLARQRPL